MDAKRRFRAVGAAIIFAVAAAFSIAFLAGRAAAIAPVGSTDGVAGATATPVCGVAWRAVDAPNPGPNVNLRGVAAIAQGDVWAVGDYNGGRQLLTMHWDGNAWNVIPNPNPGGNYANYLYAVSGVASNDVWAVGFYRQFSPNSLIMHWDGTAWSYEPGPYPGSIPWLYAVAAISANDVWAVGSQGNTNSLIYHYNGSAWSIVPSPNIGTLYGAGGTGPNDAWAVGTNGILHWNGTAWSATGAVDLGAVRDVDALTPNDAWVVRDSGVEHWNGTQWDISHIGGGTSLDAIAANDVWVASASGLLHWDGTAWNTVPSPYSGLTGISAVSAADIWAVGSSNGTGLTEHYSFACTVGTVTPTNTATATASATATPTCGPPAWSVTQTQDVGIDDNYLYGVTAVSPTDIWAVGYYCPGSCSTSPSQTLVEHWDGSVWSGVVSPNAGTGSNSLLSVTAANASNVWAVGSYQVSGVDRTLIMRWDGSAWTVVPSPNMGTGRNLLNSVDFTSINDGWAVGMYINGGVGQTLVEGWNGSAWSVVASPNSGTELNTLNGVSALSLTDTWAVGTYFSSGIARTLTLHWNGAAWSVVTSPSVGTEPNFLTGVTALAPGNAWAVGYYFINGSVTQTLIEHWTGSAWSVVPSPNVGTGANFLRGVAGSGVNDVWAVGYYCSGACGTGSPYQTLVEHWDGSAWTVSSSPNVGTGYNYLLGVVAPTSSETWAVGYYRNAGSIYRTLALRRFGVACPTVTTTPTVTPSRTPTRTPSVTRTGTQSPVATATTTPTPTITTTGTQTPGATETAAVTASPTTCAMSFSDVQPSDYFYEAVRYLYCAGVISGYSDGTFRPYNNTIRGQLSKIVVLAEGWTQSCSTQHFSDVPPSHPFYCYIETAFAHGIISGYSDGTFRPFNNVTRGQLSKIVVLAEGWANSCTTQHFSDVPPSHPFFCYVETAFAHGIISGYADGTFRPENSATRGQISKIVYQAVTGP